MNQLPTDTQQLTVSQPAPRSSRLAGHARIIGSLVLLYLVGPALWCGYALHSQPVSSPAWHARSRRESLHLALAVGWSLLCYAILAYCRDLVGPAWTGLFTLFATWVHLPFLAAFGATSLFPPTPFNLPVRWLLALPLVPLIAALCTERGPAPPTEIVRVITPQEQQHQQQVEEAARAQRRTEAQALRARKAARAPRTRIKPPVYPTEPHVPPATSLWGSIDWSTVPDTDPLKQAAHAAAEERLNLPQETISSVKRQTRSTAPARPVLLPNSHVSSDVDVWAHGDGSVTL
jgi:hypothetical protein